MEPFWSARRAFASAKRSPSHIRLRRLPTVSRPCWGGHVGGGSWSYRNKESSTMKTSVIVCAALAGTLGFSGIALAAIAGTPYAAQLEAQQYQQEQRGGHQAYQQRSQDPQRSQRYRQRNPAYQQRSQAYQQPRYANTAPRYYANDPLYDANDPRYDGNPPRYYDDPGFHPRVIHTAPYAMYSN